MRKIQYDQMCFFEISPKMNKIPVLLLWKGFQDFKISSKWQNFSKFDHTGWKFTAKQVM